MSRRRRRFVAGLPVLAAVAVGAASCGSRATLNMGDDPDFIWWTNFESGTLDDWLEGGSGSSAGGRLSTSQMFGGPPATIAASKDQAWSGLYSMRATITPGGAPPSGPLSGPPAIASAVAVRSAGLPAEGYYSARVYLQGLAYPPMGDFWLFFKFRTHDATGFAADLWDVGFEVGGPSGGLVVDVFRQSSGPGSIPVRYPPMAPQHVPMNQWFQIEAFYRPATDSTGILQIWQDGALIYDIESPPPSPSTFVEWDLGSVSNGLSLPTVSIYIDDVAVTRRRLGPSFGPFWSGN